MTLDIRAVLLAFAALAIGGVIYAMSQSGGDDAGAGDKPAASTLDLDDIERWPWKLQRARDTAGLDWEDVPGRVYDSKRMCERHKSEIMQMTNRLHRCKRRDED